jgi:NADPH2:quinone reductase
MRAVRIEATGGPEVLQVVELPVPEPGPHEVLVRNHAVGVGKPDVLVRTGRYAWMPKLPAVIGIESAGIVERVGSAVRGMAAGDAVYVNARDLPERSGGYAQYRTAPAEAAHRLPPGCDLLRAAALGNYQVAECLLRMAGGFPLPRSVAVFGAAGGVGSAALQLAVVRGWQAFAVVSSPDKCAFATAQGADHAIDSSREDPVEAIRERTGGRGVDLLLDIASGDSLPPLFKALAPMGIVVSYGFLEGEPSAASVPAMRRRFGDSPGWRLFSMHALDTQAELRKEVTASVISAFSLGRIVPAIHACYPLDQARAAHEAFEGRGLRGKIVLRA